jgi:hypothetical protein
MLAASSAASSCAELIGSNIAVETLADRRFDVRQPRCFLSLREHSALVVGERPDWKLGPEKSHLNLSFRISAARNVG